MASIVITAAGNGTRANLGYNKMLHDIDGFTVLEICVSKIVALNYFKQIIITHSKQDEVIYKQLLSNYNVTFVCGGDSRMDSVYNGVKMATSEYVYIHDGARINVTSELFERLRSFSKQYDGLSLATKAIDTTLEAVDGKIIKVLNREQLYNMQTPQVVNRNVYIECYNQAVIEQRLFSDEMSMLAHYDYECHIVISEYYNTKLTTAKDFKELNGKVD